MTDPMEQRLHALEHLQKSGEPLTPYDLGTLAAIRRKGDPRMVARADVVERVEAARARKRAARKPVRARRSVFDPEPDTSERVLP